MKTLISALIVSVALAAPVFADSQHHGDENQSSSNNMMGTQEHMQSMQAMMKNLKKESNPKKRSELIDAHMQAMKGMMNNHSEEAGASMPIDQRMDMMNKRMNMMQMMMGQMMDNMTEARKDRPNHIKK